MSKTLKLTVSFPMTIVVKTETIKDLQETRAQAREIPDEEMATLKGEQKFRTELFRSDRPDEELLELVYRSGIRELLREDFIKQITGNEATVRLGSVKVAFEAPMVPVVKPDDVCGGPRWTETV
ncbi:MAG: hypothetical protein ACOH2R_17435 [Pseudomonas sp.]